MSDFESVEIYGQNIELFNLEPGEHATDVMILTRTVYADEDGDLQDTLKCVTTTNTTGLIRVGMLAMAKESESKGWTDRYEENHEHHRQRTLRNAHWEANHSAIR